MSIKYYFNLFIPPVTMERVEGDILSGVRRGFFMNYDKIRDKISSESDANALSYVYTIEKDKPMKWNVRSYDGTLLQETVLADDGRYYLCEYEDARLSKRILFSRLHTLLRAEFFDQNGEVMVSVEPRKAKEELCLLMRRRSSGQPIIMYSRPELDADLIPAVIRRFSADVVIAQTNEGPVLYLSEGLRETFLDFCEQYRAEHQKTNDENYLTGGSSLGERLSVSDFNVKRNLSSSIDITKAADFTYDASESQTQPESPADSVATGAETPSEEPASSDRSQTIPPVEDIVKEINSAVEAADPSRGSDSEPDKVIEADGVTYCYYGELDRYGNRSGYGRTVTPDGRTAYEGCYLDDKRSGNGSYFYRDGSLCYTGDWDDNRRSGMGVGVSSHDGSVHVGRWIDNKPIGNGVRMTSDGDLKFVCKQLENGSTVLFNFMPDDSVIMSKYDEKGRKLGDETISLTDFLSQK